MKKLTTLAIALAGVAMLSTTVLASQRVPGWNGDHSPRDCRNFYYTNGGCGGRAVRLSHPTPRYHGDIHQRPRYVVRERGRPMRGAYAPSYGGRGSYAPDYTTSYAPDYGNSGYATRGRSAHAERRVTVQRTEQRVYRGTERVYRGTEREFKGQLLVNRATGKQIFIPAGAGPRY